MDEGNISQDVTIGQNIYRYGKRCYIIIYYNGNGEGTPSVADEFTAADGSLTFQIGANKDQNISLSIGDMSASWFRCLKVL